MKDDARYTHKIKLYVQDQISRYGMFVTDTRSGCTQHADVLASVPYEETRAKLIAELKIRTDETVKD